jgi:hypothetical protein
MGSREGRAGAGLAVAGIALTVLIPAGEALGLRLPRWALLLSFWGGLALLIVGVGLLAHAAFWPRPRQGSIAQGFPAFRVKGTDFGKASLRDMTIKTEPAPPPAPSIGIEFEGYAAGSDLDISGFDKAIRTGPDSDVILERIKARGPSGSGPPPQAPSAAQSPPAMNRKARRKAARQRRKKRNRNRGK